MNEHTLYSGLTSDPCEEVLKWKHPFTCIVGGPSGSGKTSFVIKLIKDAVSLLTHHKPNMLEEVSEEDRTDRIKHAISQCTSGMINMVC